MTNPDQCRTDASTSVPGRGEYFQDVLSRAMERRKFLKGLGASGTVLLLTPTVVKPREAQAASKRRSTLRDPGDRLTFQTVAAGNNTDVVVPVDYAYDVVIRWGEPLRSNGPTFDVNRQTRESQAQQFGFNCDLVLWYPLPRWVRQTVTRTGELLPIIDFVLGLRLKDLYQRPSTRALMAVNHEYTNGPQMFPTYSAINTADGPTAEQVQHREAEIEAHGFSIIEVRRTRDGRTEFVADSPFNRRITGSTPMDITGPLAGSPLMQTEADPAGREVLGCLNNCAGGKTPWGTVLTCEENFDQYFANFNDNGPLTRFSRRIAPRTGASRRQWEDVDPRFDLAQNPQEYHRFGYVVEIDPFDPNARAKKRTALGRFKHEGAAATLANNGQAVVYSGDDARFEYVYKFVSNKRYNPINRRHNLSLLEEGTLYVARFDAGDATDNDMGPGTWLPLVWEPGNIFERNGYRNQQEVLLDTRGAADLVGATPMDRPEDIQVSEKDGRVIVALTNNSRRTEGNEANPRSPNPHGHLVEILEDGNDAASQTFRWNIFIRCGNPTVAADATRFGTLKDPVTAGVSPISDPDNLVFDDDGNLWISTDGQFFSGGAGFGQNDGVFAVPVEGQNRGVLRQFLSAVPGCEVCGPEFSGDNRTFFCAIQHPHDSDGGGGTAFTPKDREGQPIPRWPVGEDAVSRPSVIAVRHKRGSKIGR